MFTCSNDNCRENDVFCYTPLIYAASVGHVEVMRVLLEGGTNVDRATAFGRTVLHHAALTGCLDVIRLLLHWGAKMDPLNVWQNTPLHDAADEGYLSMVRMLVENGADVTLKNRKGQIPSDVAHSKENTDVAEWLDSVSCR